MQPNNQKMFELVKMIPRTIIKKVATFPPFTGSDLERYNDVLDSQEPACDTYLEILHNDEVECTPSDVIDMRNLIRKMNQAAFFDFLDVLEEVRDYVVEKVEQAEEEGQEDGEETDTVVA